MEAEFRVGRSVGRTIYQDNELVGLMDTRELAEQVVEALNRPEPEINAAAVRSIVESLLFQPPEMQAFWMNELERVLAGG